MPRGWTIYFFILCNLISGQELPPIKNFPPKEYGAENQNWGIDQSDDRLIYIANNSGLLEYNGADWTLFPSVNETIVRSVKAVNDRIYTGCYREFGYWTKTDFGILQYTSLSDKIKDELLEDEEFWSIAHVEGKVFFQSKKRVYSYDLSNNTYDYFPSISSLPKIFNTATGVFIQNDNEGLYQISGGKKVLIASDELFQNDEVVNVFSFDDGLTVLTRHEGFYKMREGGLKKWEIPADIELIGKNIYSSIRLKNGKYALGTVSNGLLVIDRYGNVEYGINRIKGLRNNTVLSLDEDVEGNLWLGLDNGISCINFNSPFKVFNDTKGAIGSVYAAIRLEDDLYLGTNQGLYRKSLLNDNSSEFHMVNGTQGQVWSLNKFGDYLFCGHHTGTFSIEGDTAVKIADIPGTWQIKKIDGANNLLLQGNYDGLYVVALQDGRWQVRNKIQGFDHSSRYFEIFGENIFVSHEYKGVFQIRVNPKLTKALQVDIDLLEPGFNSSIKKFGGELYYAHKNGVLVYDINENMFVGDTLLGKVYDKDTYVSGKMVVDPKNEFLWLFSRNTINKAYKGKLNETYLIEDIAIDKNAREGIDGYECISWIGDDKYLIGTSSGYIVQDMSKMANKEFQVHIGTISRQSKKQSGQFLSYVDKTTDGNFSNDGNNLNFSYYTSIYDAYNTPRYQYRLLGDYPSWSDWSEVPSVGFENLPFGKYTFEVRAAVGNKLSSNTAVFSFVIERPVYLSNMAIVLYGIVAILGLAAIHGTYRKYYRDKQKKLIEKNQKELLLANARNEREIIKIKNEQLKKEFKSKSNELAASTLSIIRKNELLTKVKEELMTSKDESQTFVGPIIDIIDKNLKKNDDWEFFKEAFDNADRKFIKKLKKAHPQLTPNDIRLCAYLRLNLTSKEIAPLLNISPRSVEIKRYRLRKKMGLSHDHNLVKYILEL